MADEPSVHGLDRGRETIAGTAFGDYQLRLRRVDLYLAPQAQDLYVDGAVVDFIIVAPAHFDQLIARHDAIGRCQQGGEQIEFAVAERDGAAGTPAEMS